MRKYTLLSLIVVTLLMVSGCQLVPSSDNESDLTGKIVLDDDDFVFLDDDEIEDNETDNETAVAPVEDDEPLPTTDVDEEDVAFTVTVVEGELISLDLEAVDPDGDTIEYTFTTPLSAQGRWQTQIGDEGRYLTTITASDGKLSTSEDVLLVIERANRPPVIECLDALAIQEGEDLVVDCNIYDEEGDSILVSYEGWTTSSLKTTSFDDAGDYTVLVRATDGNEESTKTIDVTVKNVNRAPSIAPVDDLTIMETTTVSISPTTADEDGDEVTLSYSSPLDNNGEWVTTDGDAGTYEISVTASDGSATATESFTITVTQINTAPVLKDIDNINVKEGETIKLPVNAYDPEGDELTISYSGFMDDEEYTATYNDAGSYEQTVTVSDGVLSTTQTFTIDIEDENRAPVFTIG